jgi:hypothetical protein
LLLRCNHTRSGSEEDSAAAEAVAALREEVMLKQGELDARDAELTELRAAKTSAGSRTDESALRIAQLEQELQAARIAKAGGGCKCSVM